jgi:hypothetical protein
LNQSLPFVFSRSAFLIFFRARFPIFGPIG